MQPGDILHNIERIHLQPQREWTDSTTCGKVLHLLQEYDRCGVNQRLVLHKRTEGVCMSYGSTKVSVDFLVSRRGDILQDGAVRGANILRNVQPGLSKFIQRSSFTVGFWLASVQCRTLENTGFQPYMMRTASESDTEMVFGPSRSSGDLYF